MFCPNCGKDCQNANFCSNCGQDLRIQTAEAVPDAEPEPHECNETELSNPPEPPIGRYYNHGHDYFEIREDSVRICKIPRVETPTIREVPYSRISAISFASAEAFSNGYLSIGDREKSSRPSGSLLEANQDERSIVFSKNKNDCFLKLYEFLKFYAPKATKNHQMEKWPANAAPEPEQTPAYMISYPPDPDAWYPGREKDQRKSRKAQLDAEGEVYCPKCLSTKISANQKGFGFVRGALGLGIGADVGLIAGGIGSKKVICTCLKCGYQWKAGKK